MVNDWLGALPLAVAQQEGSGGGCGHDPRGRPLNQWLCRERRTCEEQTNIQCGLQYVQFDTGTIEINAETDTRKIKVVQTAGSKTRPLSEWKKTKCREVLGSLQWVATQFLFWITVDVALLQKRVSQGETDLLTDINKCVRHAHETRHLPLRYAPIMGKPIVIAWGDRAWANLTCGTSQGAYLVGYCGEEFLQGMWGRVGVANLASKKLSRVARSSLAMETQSISIAYKEAEYVRAAWFWFHHAGEPAITEAKVCMTPWRGVKAQAWASAIAALRLRL